jgi:hypothetical protein
MYIGLILYNTSYLLLFFTFNQVYNKIYLGLCNKQIIYTMSSDPNMSPDTPAIVQNESVTVTESSCASSAADDQDTADQNAAAASMKMEDMMLPFLKQLMGGGPNMFSQMGKPDGEDPSSSDEQESSSGHEMFYIHFAQQLLESVQNIEKILSKVFGAPSPEPVVAGNDT